MTTILSATGLTSQMHLGLGDAVDEPPEYWHSAEGLEPLYVRAVSHGHERGSQAMRRGWPTSCQPLQAPQDLQPVDRIVVRLSQ